MSYLLDTNILMNFPELLENLQPGEEYIVSEYSLQELDYKKESKDSETAYKARRASHYLIKHFNDICFLESDNFSKDLTVDDKLLEIADKYDFVVFTGDLNMCLKAKIKDIPYIFYNKDYNNYCGVQYYEVVLDDNNYNLELDLMLSEGQLPKDMKLNPNEFLIVTDTEDVTLAIFQWRNDKLEVVKDRYIKNMFIGTAAARNREQSCLLSLLFNKNISIISANGTYGSGKTYLTLNYALQELEKGRINKIVFVPNNSFVNNAREHGYEPGSPVEKELAFLGTIIDIMGEAYVLEAINKGEIEVVPLATMRGRNFDNALILVNEAQNLTEDHIKLLIGRVGQNSRIIFDGDQKQTDSSLFKNKNGLQLLSKLKDSPKFADIFGMVRLQKVERSFTAQAADYLDNL